MAVWALCLCPSSSVSPWGPVRAPSPWQGMCPYYLWRVIATQSSRMYAAERDEKHTAGLVYVGSALSIATRPLRRAALSGFIFFVTIGTPT